jgi:heavy metal sensor kinase
VFLVVIPLLILCAATGGYFLAGRSLAPVSAMTARAAAISATNLHERLPIGGGDELVGLARVVNDLLERLEVAFEQQRRFMADASHELRTPTAILRTEADVTLSRDHRTEDEYRDSMTVIQDAARRLTRIVEDLFLLARADSGNLVARHEPLYLDEIVDDTVRGVRQVAERRDVRISIRHTIEAPLDGDADLLGRLLLNLLDNAIKHSPEGGTVDVGMSRTDGRYEIAVIDAGAGIPAEARDRVFERFFRVDAARSRGDATTTGGAGLGLAIARRIAELHGGGLDLIDSRPGRTEFRLTLPSNTTE